MQLNYIDIAVVCILLFGAIDGLGKGFIVTFLNIAGIFISLYFARYFSGTLSSFLIGHTNVMKGLEGQFLKRTEALSKGTLNLFNIMGKDRYGVADNLSLLFIKVACFLCIFIIVTLIINVIKDLLKFKIRRTPLRYLDLSLGFIIGLIKASLIIFIFFAVATPIIALLPQSNEFTVLLNTSKVAKYFYLYNFILPWIHKINTAGVIFF